MVRWGGDLPTRYRWGYIEGRKYANKIYVMFMWVGSQGVSLITDIDPP